MTLTIETAISGLITSILFAFWLDNIWAGFFILSLLNSIWTLLLIHKRR